MTIATSKAPVQRCTTPTPPRRRPRSRALFLPLPPLFRPPLFTAPVAPRRRLRARTITCARLQPTSPATQYVPLHVHSDFSLLDGASQLPALVRRAAELHVPALALTDHGVLYGAIQLVRACERQGVKPIIGNEMYVVNDGFGEEGAEQQKRYHLIVLARNTVGYRNLVKLTTLAHLEGKVGKGIFARPCVNKAQLYAHREGLIVSSACLGGEIPQAILNGDLEVAGTVTRWYRDVFGDDFYLEIQDHGSAEDKRVNPRIIELGREHSVPVIATNDSHFTSCLDAEAHDAMICIQTGKLLTDENRLHYAGNEYFKSVEEMRECFVDHLPLTEVDAALCNTLGVADKVEKYDLFGETRIPDFPVPRGFTNSHDEYLIHVAHKSLEARLKARQTAGLAEAGAEHLYHERLSLELDMIVQMGFASYFLVVWDYVRHAKENGIPVGPGRGSAAGSLVAFALRITDVDPIPFNLLFERFLNPERKSMPDIDTDFSVKGREKIIAYVSERYGSDRVAQIITFNRLTSKAVLKDVARVHKVPYADADRLAKLIPVVRGKPATLTAMLAEDTPNADFKRTIDRNPPYKTWIDKAKRIEGANKTYGIHAAGVVISASPLTDIVPLSRAKHGETITQYAMEDVESLGLLKMDFLGLKNLTVIETALEFINEGRRQEGISGDLEFSVDTLPLDDEKTYQLLAEGELDGIFQLDASGGMRSIVRELRPSSLEDISSILALYRPGPLDAGLIPKFIRRKHGLDPIKYDHPLLEPILKETYGIMVYQEQIMRIARDLAGYSLGQADILRRAMGKKQTADMAREKPRFVEGAKARGVPEDNAEQLFDQMIKFAEYCFNKSHSTAYAYLTYQTAYLKANYPVEYSAALLRSNMSQSDKLVRYLADANASGVRVAPPCVNKSDLGFTVDRQDGGQAVVLFGLEAVKAVGESVSRALLEEREARGPFTNIIDLIERVNLRVLNKRAMGALIKAGAFDRLYPNRKILLENLDALLALRRKLRDRKKRREAKNLSVEDEEKAAEADLRDWEEAELQLTKDSETESDFPLLERLAGEKATLGFYASGHPLSDLHDIGRTLGCTRVDHIVGDAPEQDPLSSDEDILPARGALADGSEVMILSCVTELKRIKTAKGKKMAKWMIEDSTARIEGIVFPGQYDIMEEVFRVGHEGSGSVEAAEFNEASNQAADSKTEDVVHVVEEGARVIVWGKIDRESSGTSQIIIDDVQRVESVRALVATARHDVHQTRAVHVQILRHMAAKLLDVNLSDTGFGSYVDKNGETKRRRWSKSTKLSEKNRIPLVLRCLDEDGKACAHVNAGNIVRLPSNCSYLLDSLREETGFEFTFLSVSAELGANVPATPRTDVNGNAESDREDERRDATQHAPNHESDLKGTDVLGHEKGERIAANNDDFGAPTPSGREDFSSEYHAKTDDEVISKASDLIPQIARSHATAESPVTSHDPDHPPKISSQPASANSRRENQHEHMGDKLQEPDVSGMGDDESRYVEPNKFVPSPSKLFKQTPVHGLTTSRKEAALYASLRLPYARRTVREAVGVGSSPSAYTAGGAHGSRGTFATQSADYVDRTFSVTSASTKVEWTDAHKPVGTVSQIDNASGGSGRGRRTNEADGEEAPPVTYRQDDENVPLHHEFERLRKLDLQHATGNEVALGATTPRLEDNRSAPAAIKAVSPRLCVDNEIVVVYDECGYSGLLDAVSLVAGRVAEEHIGHCTISALTGVDVSNLVESSVSLRVCGRVAYAVGNELYVSVDIKETAPSGKRKRVRSFGPVAAVFGCEMPLPPVPLKTKKAQKLADAVAFQLDKATSSAALQGNAVEETVSSGKDPSTLLRSSVADFSVFETTRSDEAAGTIHDGGCLLLSMSRAAKLCVDRALPRDQKSNNMSLDAFIVRKSADMLQRIGSVQVRVHVEGISFGTIRVQSEAIVSDEAGMSISCVASFRVTGPKLERGRSLKVVQDEDPLFTGEEISKVMGSLSRRISSRE